ncbi:MAG: glycosyltransferase [Phycisphaerales bacterium JB039]
MRAHAHRAPIEVAPESRFEATGVVRMDMHVHSRASDRPVIGALGRLGCPESFSEPEAVYDRARAEGMGLVTLTDHDTIAGAMELVERGFEGVVVGEEVTVFFPEDGCKLHVLLWGLSPEQHALIEENRLREDVYAFAAWVRTEKLAHALAHPLYIQNRRLTPWHLERAALLFKGFEVLNGAHCGAHRRTLEAWLASLTPGRALELIDRHGIEPLWARIWEKSLTAGSDDHALLNVGRTWTEVETDDPPSPEAFLGAVMAGRGAAGGQAGHSALLAHQLMSVGLHWYSRRAHRRLRPCGRRIGSAVAGLAGAAAPRPRKLALAVDVARSRVRRMRRGSSGGSLALGALRDAIGPALERHPEIAAALRGEGGPPAMADHEHMAAFTDDLCETLSRTLAGSAIQRLRKGDRSGLVDAAIGYGWVLAAQAPHIFSLFHQNKERRLLREIESQSPDAPARPLKVMLFTDTLGDVNGVCRFIQNMGEQAAAAGRDLRIVTSTRLEVPGRPYIHNLDPIFSTSMPRYENLELALPPVVRMLRLADREQPDVVHISTPGPVGMCGMVAAKMLRAAVVGVYHTDFPAYVDHLFGDEMYTHATSRFMSHFYRQFETIFSRSADYMDSLAGLGVGRERLVRLTPGVALDSFRPDYRDCGIWDGYGLQRDSVKVLYVGRVSVEKNLPLLTRAWPEARKAAAARGVRAALVVVGDGPYREQMQEALRGESACFLGFRHGVELSRLYASSDLFVFPSLTDTLGQVVLESQASGLPVLVSDKGGPKEVVDEDITGFILPGGRSEPWADAMARLAIDAALRTRMGRSAVTRSARFSLKACFEQFWEVHERAAESSAPAPRRAGRPARPAAAAS